jgi:hypothetical protein
MTDIWHQHLSTKAECSQEGGGGLWEGGDTLERLSLVDDEAEWEEVPIKLPQEVFSLVSVVYKSEVIVIGGESALFASRDISR